MEQFMGGDAHKQFSQTSIVLPFTSEDRRKMILGPRPGVSVRRGPRNVPARHPTSVARCNRARRTHGEKRKSTLGNRAIPHGPSHRLAGSELKGCLAVLVVQADAPCPVAAKMRPLNGTLHICAQSIDGGSRLQASACKWL